MPQPEKQDADLGFEDIGSRNENLKSENDIPKDLQVLSSAAEDAVAQADQPSPDSKLSSPNTTNKAQRFRSQFLKKNLNQVYICMLLKLKKIKI